jgi:hypothetical protein
MATDFYHLYKNYNQQKIFKILLNPGEYQPLAIEAAKQIVKDKNWDKEYAKIYEERQKEIEKQEEELNLEIEEKANYYKEIVNLKNQKNSLQVRIGDVVKFEGALKEHQIEFYREDKNIGAQLDQYPTQTYYFNAEDLEKVDKITIEIGLVAAAYVDHKPFMKFEIIVIIIVILIVLAFLGLHI